MRRTPRAKENKNPVSIEPIGYIDVRSEKVGVQEGSTPNIVGLGAARDSVQSFSHIW